jgi:abortive infection bacteriophage resistance protein
MKKPFTKPPSSIGEQIELLESRGIRVDDKEAAAHDLHYIGYYRLSGYTHYYKNDQDTYHPDTNWRQVVQHYSFDRDLKRLLFDAIEQIEIALRSVMTTVMTNYYGAFWYQSDNVFVTHINTRPFNALEFIERAIKETTVDRRNKDVFLRHYYDTYSFPDLPPSWVMMETVSLGTISRMLSFLTDENRKAISLFFKVDEKAFVSWIRGITHLRNLCAHHARIWNRTFIIRPKPDKHYAACRTSAFYKRKVFSYLGIIAILLKTIDPKNTWIQSIQKLLNRFDHPYVEDMGMPENWAELLGEVSGN